MVDHLLTIFILLPFGILKIRQQAADFYVVKHNFT